jgi:hypothetical protein
MTVVNFTGTKQPKSTTGKEQAEELDRRARLAKLAGIPPYTPVTQWLLEQGLISGRLLDDNGRFSNTPFVLSPKAERLLQPQRSLREEEQITAATIRPRLAPLATAALRRSRYK